MKSQSDIVEGGGWITRQTLGRPRARLFGFLSIIWLCVSICASLPWLCSVLLVPQPVFVVLAVVFLRTEQPRTITEEHPNPDHDMRKLY